MKDSKMERLAQLREKYGEETVSVIDAEKVVPYLQGLYTCKKFAHVTTGGLTVPLLSYIHANRSSMKRYLAELDPSVKQLVCYCEVASKDDKIFTTRRLKGDSRLTGQLSMGTGGHVDQGEDCYTALYRELQEEIGLEQENIFSCHLEGFIYNGSSEVDSVHLGVVFSVIVNEPADVSVKETDKLEGRWMTINELREHKKEFESWSQILINRFYESEEN